MIKYTWDSEDPNTYNNRSGHYKFERQFEFINRHAKNRYDKILDVAGGSGRFSIPLLKYSNDITLIDIDKLGIELVQQRNKNIKTICGDFRKIELKEKFSLIICIEAIGSFHDLNFLYNKIDSLLIADGRFVFTHTNPTSWRSILWKLRNPKINYKEKELSEIKKTLKQHHFEIETIEGFNWIPLPLSSNSKFVSFFVFIEKFLGLKYWISQSPWLLISVKKITE